MKVVHVFKDCYPPIVGGVEVHINQVVHALAGFEFTTLVASRSRHRSEGDDGEVRVVRVGELGRLASAPVTLAWRRELQALDPDVAHFHMPNPFAELAFLTLPRPPRLVASYHAEPVRSRVLGPPYRALQRRFLGRADRIVVSSPLLADASPVLRAHRPRVTVVPYGFDPGRWPSEDAHVEELRRRHGTPLVLFLGRLVAYKGVAVLLEAMPSVDAHLVVVGDGPERARLERLAAAPDLRGRVAFVGEVGNEARGAYYRAADVFVLPSVTRAEAFGMAMLEAMSFGTPAVSTELGTATSSVNVDGETGLVVPAGDARALAGAITTLVHDKELRDRLGAGAARRARMCFPEGAMIEALAGLYRSVAAAAAGARAGALVRWG